MKKILCLIFSLLLLCSFVLAQGKGPNEIAELNIPEDILNNGLIDNISDIINDLDDVNEIVLDIESQVRQRVRNVHEVKEMVHEKKQLMEQEIETISDKITQNVFRNQNEVRATVHSLLALDDLVGSIGPQVSEIARDFNNSINQSLKFEEKIMSRSNFRRFFFGGDKPAAEDLKQLVNRNQERVQELRQLLDDCEDCDEEVKEFMQEQIQQLNQEQQRLSELAENEKNKKGIFGWIWR